MDAERLQTFCLDLGIRLVILFGSRAKATPKAAPGSDLDVAVLLPRDWTSGDLFQKCLAELSEVFADYDLDLVPKFAMLQDKYGKQEIQELFEEVEGNSETAASSAGTVPA
jgi:predicted nucleotidyltransferase